MRFETLTLAHALHVIDRMRPMDRACAVAVLGLDWDREAFAVNRWQTDGPAWTMVGEGGEPLAVGGLSFSNAWTGVLWLICSDHLQGPQTWRKLLRHMGKVMRSALDPANPYARRRIEAHVLASWPEAQSLVRHLGMTLEGTRRGAGCGGEDLQIWATLA